MKPKSSSSVSSSGKATGSHSNTKGHGGGPPALAALKNRRRNASKGGGSSSGSRYWLCWASIVAAAAVSVLLAQQQYGNALSQAEQLGEMSEEDVINLWKQNCARGAVTNVDRVPLSEMTVQRFHREYLLPRKAVVITNAYASSPLTAASNDENDTSSSSSRWSFSGIRQAYGHVNLETMLPMRPGQTGRCTASGLCQGPIMTLAKFFNETFLLDMSERIRRSKHVQGINTGVADNHVQHAYTHDINLETTLPGVFDEYKKLSILTEDLHLATRSGNLNNWPSLFLGPATTKTGLHVDNLGTSFSMAVFRGRKQFVLFDVIDGNQHLCLNQPGGGLWSNYGVDAFSPNFRNCPMAKRAHPQFASLGPGDLLYVPGSMHHAARNMDDSISIAQNFLTIVDYHAVVESHKGKQIQSLRRLRGQPVTIPDSLLAQLDLFKILQETGYYNEHYYMDSNSSSDDDNDSINNDPVFFVSVPDSVRLATQRVVKHLEKALAQEPLLATRVAFLASNPYAVLSLKTAGVWNCLDDADPMRLYQNFLSTSPPAVPLKNIDDDVFNRIRQAVAAASEQQEQQREQSECQTVMRQYVKALEANRQRALVALENETGLEK